TPVADPNRPFGELEAAGDLLDLRGRVDDGIERWIEPHDLVRDWLDPADLTRLVERQCRRTDPHVVRRWVGQRAVDRENRELELLAWSHIVPEDDAVRRVPSLDQLTPCLAEDEGQLAVEPDLGVVVHGDLEDRGRPSGVERSEPLRNRDLEPVPAERQATGRAARLEGGRPDHGPTGVVEAGGAGVGTDVVGATGSPARLQVRARRAEVNLYDLRVAVTPLAAHQPHARRRAEVDDRLGPPARRRVAGRLCCHRCETGRHQEQPGERAHRHMPPFVTLTVQYRHGPSTAFNQCGMPLGTTITSPARSWSGSPP